MIEYGALLGVVIGCILVVAAFVFLFIVLLMLHSPQYKSIKERIFKKKSKEL